MSYQLLVREECDVEDDEDRSSNRQILGIACVASVLLHLIILGYWPFNTSHLNTFRSLEITLNTNPLRLLPVTSKDTGELTSSSVVTTSAIEPQLSMEEMSKHSLDEPASSIQGFRLYARAIETAREVTLPKSKIYKSFSTQDFPQDEKPDLFRPVDYLPVMISQPRTVEIQDANGYYTILKTDGFGNRRCFQQRGFAGDGNPPLWYLIPSETCGHL